MEWWVWIARYFLFCVRYSRLYWLYHKKHETLTTIRHIHFYINRISDLLVIKIKDGYKLE